MINYCSLESCGDSNPCDDGGECLVNDHNQFECLCEAGQICSAACADTTLLFLEANTQACTGKKVYAYIAITYCD